MIAVFAYQRPMITSGLQQMPRPQLSNDPRLSEDVTEARQL